MYDLELLDQQHYSVWTVVRIDKMTGYFRCMNFILMSTSLTHPWKPMLHQIIQKSQYKQIYRTNSNSKDKGKNLGEYETFERKNSQGIIPLKRKVRIKINTDLKLEQLQVAKTQRKNFIVKKFLCKENLWFQNLLSEGIQDMPFKNVSLWHINYLDQKHL